MVLTHQQCKINSENTIDINQTKMIILGNKIDLEQERVISTLTAKQRFMQKFQLPYFESSAKLDKGIKQSLMFLIKQIFTNLQNNLVTGTKFNSKTEKSINSSKLESVLSIQAKKKQSYKCCDS